MTGKKQNSCLRQGGCCKDGKFASVKEKARLVFNGRCLKKIFLMAGKDGKDGKDGINGNK